MSRVRQLYQSAALFVSPSPATGYMFSSGNSGVNLLQQIPRAQSASLQFSVPRTDVAQLGQLSVVDRVIIQPPTASLNFSYYPVDGKAEAVLGFAASGQSTFISGLIDNTQGEKNYFVQISPEGYDAIGYTNSGLNNVISLGNGFISNYSLNLAVGQIPTAQVTVEGLNAQFDTGSWQKSSPAVVPENGLNITGVNFSLPVAVGYTGGNIASALRPGDIVANFPINNAMGSYLSGANSVNIQSISISVPLSRTPIQRLGSPFPFTRVVQFPLQMSINVEAMATEVRESKLSDVLCNDQFYDFQVKMKNPACGGTGSNAITLDFKKAKLDSTEWSMDVGSVGATVRMNYIAQIGGIGSPDGLYFSGSYN